MKIQNQNRSSLDLPQLLHHHVQQVHPRPQALQLAIPNLTHHDPHVLLFLPCLPFVKVFKVVELPSTMTCDFYLKSVVPIGALYSLSLWFSNSTYIYFSVSFIQMLKALMPVAIYSIGVLNTGKGEKIQGPNIRVLNTGRGEIRSFEYKVQTLIFTKLSLLILFLFHFCAIFCFGT